MPKILVDIAEFIENPVRTGIQRVVRELVSRWPSDVEVSFVRFNQSLNALCVIPREAIEYAIEIASNPYGSIEKLSAVIREFLALSPVTPIEIMVGDRILVPELFISSSRFIFYRDIQKIGAILYVVLYDIVPWTHPDAMNVVYLGGFNDYLNVVKRADHRCFDSFAVRDDYYTRILRAPVQDEFVASLGADGLGSVKAVSKRDYLIYPGALDGKKQQDRVFRAFRRSRAYEKYDLVLAGRVPTAPRKDMLEMLSSADPRLKIIDNPDDDALRVLIAEARACIFSSRFEGFGLPAIESLHLGTPVVVDSGLPAVSGLPTFGQIRLDADDEDQLVSVLDRLADPLEIERLQAEIENLVLPTWDAFARSIANWVNS